VSEPILFGLGEIGETQATNGWWFMTNQGRLAVVTEIGVGEDQVLPLGEPLAAEVWLDVVFVISGNQVLSYLGGTRVATAVFVRPDTSANRMQIGGWIEPENVLLGEIDDVRVFDVQLDATQVKALPSIR
jgi:hypothetical protein